MHLPLPYCPVGSVPLARWRKVVVGIAFAATLSGCNLAGVRDPSPQCDPSPEVVCFPDPYQRPDQLPYILGAAAASATTALAILFGAELSGVTDRH